jgi:hypothetical protein
MSTCILNKVCMYHVNRASLSCATSESVVVVFFLGCHRIVLELCCFQSRIFIESCFQQMFKQHVAYGKLAITLMLAGTLTLDLIVVLVRNGLLACTLVTVVGFVADPNAASGTLLLRFLCTRP